MSFFLLAREPDGTLYLLSPSSFDEQSEAIAELSRLTADAAFDAWDAQVFVATLGDAAPVLLVRPAEPAPEPPPVEVPLETDSTVVVAEAPLVEAKTGAPDGFDADMLAAYELEIEEPPSLDSDEDFVDAGDAEAHAVAEPVVDAEEPIAEDTASSADLPHTDELLLAAATSADPTADTESEDESRTEDVADAEDVNLVDVPAADAQADEVDEPEADADSSPSEPDSGELEASAEALELQDETDASAHAVESDEPQIDEEPRASDEPESPSDGGAPEDDALEQLPEAQDDDDADAPSDEEPPAPAWPWSQPSETLEVPAEDAVDAEEPEPEADVQGDESNEPEPASPAPASDETAAPDADTIADDRPTEPDQEPDDAHVAAVSQAEQDEPADEVAPAGYQPSGSTIDELTCDDCIYVDTCPNSGERVPSSCGTFQWK